MKTPTLIVRLVGFYLLVTNALTLVQIEALSSMEPVAATHALSPMIGAAQQSTINHIQTYAILGLILGITGTVFAGPLARLLTFDAKRRVTQTEVTERLLARKS